MYMKFNIYGSGELALIFKARSVHILSQLVIDKTKELSQLKILGTKYEI